MMHTNLQSVCMINVNITAPFDIKRGVRQGCPMSMIYYVIFQDPLYRAFHLSNKIVPPALPQKQIKHTGYADDTSIFVKNDEGFVESFKIIENFGKATNSRLNIHKTKIYGFGLWGDRINWPIAEVKIEVGYFRTLGIAFSCDYDSALDKTWLQIYNKLKNIIPLIKGNFYTIYQKSIIVNSLILSKVWYTAHVYPLTEEYAQKINTEIFGFIWKPRYNPIARNVLYNPKNSGGIGLINVLSKAESIFTATIIKRFAGSKKCDLIQYYMALRLNPLFGIRVLPSKFSYSTTSYYEYSMDIIRKCHQLKCFPNVKSRDIYGIILKTTQPNVERSYLNFNWRNIWRNLNFR